MKHLTGLLLAGLVIGGLIGMERASVNDPEAVRLLQQAAQAPLTQDYTAQATSFVDYGDRVLQTEATVYNARGGRLRIEYRLGSLAGVIAGSSAPGRNWRYDPLSRSMVAEVNDLRERSRASRAGDPAADPTLRMVLDNCRVRVIKHTTVAGRPATEVLLRPKGSCGERTLWIDQEHGVILRSEERNAENDLVAATAYRSIAYGKTAPPDQFLPIPPSDRPVRWVPQDDFASKALAPGEIRRAIGQPLQEPRYIPAGFVREGYYLYKCPDCGLTTAITRYVNGLDSLTIVQAPEGCGVHQGKSPVDFGLGKALHAERGTSNFWVLGELSDADLKRVRDSLGSP